MARKINRGANPIVSYVNGKPVRKRGAPVSCEYRGNTCKSIPYSTRIPLPMLAEICDLRDAGLDVSQFFREAFARHFDLMMNKKLSTQE